MFFALFFTFLSVSYDIQNDLTSFDGILPTYIQKAEKTTWYLCFECFIKETNRTRLSWKRHTKETNIWILSMFFYTGILKCISHHTVWSKRNCGSLQTKYLAWSVWIFVDFSIPPFVSSLFEPHLKDDLWLQQLQFNPKMALKRSIWIQDQWIELLFSFLSSVSWENIKIWS